jgi:hypothetical protein
MFVHTLKKVCVEVIGVDGVMSKDFALAIHGNAMQRERWVRTCVWMQSRCAAKSRFTVFPYQTTDGA